MVTERPFGLQKKQIWSQIDPDWATVYRPLKMSNSIFYWDELFHPFNITPITYYNEILHAKFNISTNFNQPNKSIRVNYYRLFILKLAI